MTDAAQPPVQPQPQQPSPPAAPITPAQTTTVAAQATPTTGSALATSTTVATSGAGAVEFYRWAFMGFPMPPPESVTMTLAIATVPFVHALSKGLLVLINKWFPGATDGIQLPPLQPLQPPVVYAPSAPTPAFQPPPGPTGPRPWPER